MADERKRSEIIKKTPLVILKTKDYGIEKYRYLHLGSIGCFDSVEKGGTRRYITYGSGQTFREGTIRHATPELSAEIDRLDAEIKGLEEKRKALLKEKFLWLHPVSWETCRAAMELITAEMKK